MRPRVFFFFFILWRVVERERFGNCFVKFGTMGDRLLVRHSCRPCTAWVAVLRPPKRFLHLLSEGVPAVPFRWCLHRFVWCMGLLFCHIENVSRRQMRFQYVLEVGCERYGCCRRSTAARKDLSQGSELCDEDTQFDFIKRYLLACCVMCKRIRFPVTASYMKHSTGL